MLRVLAAVGLGYAAIPSSDGVIHAVTSRRSNPSAQLRVIDAEGGVKCAKTRSRSPSISGGLRATLGCRAFLARRPDGAPGADGKAGLTGRLAPTATTALTARPGQPVRATANIGRNDFPEFDRQPGQDPRDARSSAGFYAIFGEADVTNLDTDEQNAVRTLSTGEFSMARIGHFMTLMKRRERIGR